MLIINENETWCHDLAKDIALQVTRVHTRSKTHTWITAHCVNKKNPSIYYETQTYCIRQEHFRFWKRMT